MSSHLSSGSQFAVYCAFKKKHNFPRYQVNFLALWYVFLKLICLLFFFYGPTWPGSCRSNTCPQLPSQWPLCRCTECSGGKPSMAAYPSVSWLHLSPAAEWTRADSWAFNTWPRNHSVMLDSDGRVRKTLSPSITNRSGRSSDSFIHPRIHSHLITPSSTV